MLLRKFMVTISLFLLLCLSYFNSAYAIPAFARQHGVSCSNCHTAWPQLNETGRKFKELGYRYPEEIGEDKRLSELFDDHFPVAALIAARPYDKKDSGDRKVRAVHEVELLIGSTVGKNWSGFMEIEAEDETGFEPEIPSATVTYSHNSALNLQLSWGSYFWSDSYGLLGDHFRLTRGHVKLFDESFGGADGGGKLRSSRQVISLYGRPVNNLFYNIGYSGIADDAEGEDASNLHFRLAFDAYKGIMLGAFGVRGESSEDAFDREFTRMGLDFQADIGNARIQGAYVNAQDDFSDPTLGEEDNDAWTLQGMYTITQGRRPVWVPLIRYDSYQRDDGNSDYGELTLNLTHYFSENTKGFIEYWKQLDVPDGKVEDDRVTIQLSIAF